MFKLRKNTKHQILEIVKTIYDAHDDIKKLLKKGHKESAASLIGDCQDALLSVGNEIFESEGEEFITVGLIENYCKDLFDIYNSLEGSDDYDCDVIYKTLNRDLTDIKKSIEKEIRGKIEVVFMPYKASMWDSLESVWKAADENTDCDAYVVPVPYYDKNSDHSLGTFHYEGELFPEYVKITHYNTYDESKRKPDVIFFHNPYDGNNFVTGVAPRFFSSELKKHTDCLVYIPYFVDPCNGESLEKITHHILTPGVINADKVFVQSETMRNTYIDVLYKNTSENNIKVLEDKVHGFGSPKYDKVLNTCEESVIIPEEWKKLIYSDDGKKKKVIFYNTSVGPLLTYNERLLKKMCHVFNTFMEKRSEMVLLWRPHPLMRSTLESMRPELLSLYDEILNQYKSGVYGIYDDSVDLSRAIAISNAYYGDHSSIVQLFAVAGKKHVLQNVDSETDTIEFIQEVCSDIYEKNKPSFAADCGVKIFKYINSVI